MDKLIYPQKLAIKHKILMKHQSIYNRLRRIEGQIRGIEEMISKDKPESELLVQLEAARSSLSSAISSLIESMMIKDESGKVSLNETSIQAILRSIK